MKIGDCYLYALQKSEQNLTNGGIKMDKPRFVQLFNECQNRLIKYNLERKNEDAIKDIQNLLVYNKRLEKKYKYTVPDSTLFALPKDFLEFVNVHGRFKRGKCTATDLNMWEAKNENVHELLADTNNKPSYDYRETFYTVGNDGVNVYTDGFDIERLMLTYYRLPVQVDIIGYRHSDGSNSSDIDPEMPDHMVNVILNMIEKQHARNEGELTSYSVDSNNVNALK